MELYPVYSMSENECIPYYYIGDTLAMMVIRYGQIKSAYAFGWSFKMEPSSYNMSLKLYDVPIGYNPYSDSLWYPHLPIPRGWVREMSAAKFRREINLALNQHIRPHREHILRFAGFVRNRP